MSKTSNAVKDRWKTANYTRLTIYLPKDQADEYKAKCSQAGLSLAEIPKAAINDFLQQNGG